MERRNLYRLCVVTVDGSHQTEPFGSRAEAIRYGKQLKTEGVAKRYTVRPVKQEKKKGSRRPRRDR